MTRFPKMAKCWFVTVVEGGECSTAHQAICIVDGFIVVVLLYWAKTMKVSGMLSCFPHGNTLLRFASSPRTAV